MACLSFWKAGLLAAASSPSSALGKPDALAKSTVHAPTFTFFQSTTTFTFRYGTGWYGEVLSRKTC